MTDHEDLAGHTQRDAEALLRAGVDLHSTQPREHHVLCWCGARTLHQRGLCDTHWEAPAAATDKHS